MTTSNVNQIATFNKSHLTNGSHLEFHNGINTALTIGTPEALHVEALADQYATLLDTEKTLVNRATAFVATTAMKEANMRRDRAVGVLLNTVKANLSSGIAKKRDAAIALNALWAPYHGITDHEYTKEGSEIDGMIAAASTPDAGKHIATLGLADDLEELDSANAAFKSAFGTKTTETTTRAPQTSTSTTDIRRQVDACFDQMVQTVNAYAIVQPTKEITAFIGTANALIQQYKVIAANQGKTSAKKPGAEPEPMPEPEPTPGPEPTPQPTPQPEAE